MAKNEQSREANQPIWFDGKSINEALFCDDFLGRHKIIYTNGAFSVSYTHFYQIMLWGFKHEKDNLPKDNENEE